MVFKLKQSFSKKIKLNGAKGGQFSFSSKTTLLKQEFNLKLKSIEFENWSIKQFKFFSSEPNYSTLLQALSLEKSSSLINLASRALTTPIAKPQAVLLKTFTKQASSFLEQVLKLPKLQAQILKYGQKQFARPLNLLKNQRN